MDLLGERVELKGWPGYNGGMDTGGNALSTGHNKSKLHKFLDFFVQQTNKQMEHTLFSHNGMV